MIAKIPVIGACVVHFSDQEKRNLGRVVKVTLHSDTPVLVHWFARNESEWLEVSKLRSGFMPGMDVLEIPSVPTAASLGEGVVHRSRLIAGHEQLLVEFPDTGEKAWLPWQNLCQIKGVKHRYILGEQDGEDAAEQLRLRTLASAPSYGTRIPVLWPASI